MNSIEDYLDTLSDRVSRNVEIVTPDELGQQQLLHISTNTNIKSFVPIIGTKQALSEDRTVPRVCTAPTLLGCMIGHAAVEWITHDNAPGEKLDGTKYKGGFVIYGIPFEYSLKPNNKLVYDSSVTDEHWLVSYSKETAQYLPTKLGKFFIRSITYIARGDKPPVSEWVFYVEVSAEEGIHFSKNIFMEKGYYRIEGPTTGHVKTWTHDSNFKVIQINKNDYLSVKNESAALLSESLGMGSTPAYLGW